jgi:hypothetical protein
VLTKTLIDCIKQTIRRGWTQGNYAVNAAGEPVAVNSPEAARFCVVGAMQLCTASDMEQRMDFYRAWSKAYPEMASIVYNDSVKSVEQVCTALDALKVLAT